MSNLITERAYWRDPVQVLTGAAWLITGLGFGFVIGALA